MCFISLLRLPHKRLAIMLNWDGNSWNINNDNKKHLDHNSPLHVLYLILFERFSFVVWPVCVRVPAHFVCVFFVVVFFLSFFFSRSFLLLLLFLNKPSSTRNHSRNVMTTCYEHFTNRMSLSDSQFQSPGCRQQSCTIVTVRESMQTLPAATERNWKPTDQNTIVSTCSGPEKGAGDSGWESNSDIGVQISIRSSGRLLKGQQSSATIHINWQHRHPQGNLTVEEKTNHTQFSVT